MPGPSHTSTEPSPIDHSTRSGWAVTVADRPGTDAVAVLGCHDAAATQSHVGRFTNCSRSYGGDVCTPGKNNGSVLRAWRARVAPSTGGGAAGSYTASCW